MEVHVTTGVSSGVPLGIPTSADIPHRYVDADTAPDSQGRKEVPIDELRFVRLETPAEIDSIRYLRDEINLPASALADPGFMTREKKETSGASWALSNAGARSSAPYGSSP